ncbi:NACHT and WD repeat domain-containing protein 2-like [Dreissena polymorpha]|uniref:NACHT domain-containing protein n=1 Tax=Dreissena polymorpha TaxID=45954 RepID=A0A9D4NAP1_DREPO|nr:NACHT and WD repeat domain-containing protein 2-like [Dreissena polymorpha]KAH3890890.1 hypothetical protein DPMN_014980 [Dreissena polymorpha]
MQRPRETRPDLDSGCHFNIRHLEDVTDDGVNGSQGQLNGLSRYQHLHQSDFKVVDGLLRGGVDLERLPCQQAKVVRMFVCSSGQDFEAERNHLFANIYPQVRQYCRENHAVDFQLVDMYWGNTGLPATDPHKMAAVHEELRHCQRTSMGPNFVLFIGQKYGNAHVPTEIAVGEMDKIKAALEKAGHDVDVLDKWFKKEMNGTPQVYCIKESKKGLAHYPEDFAEIVNLLQTGSALADSTLAEKCSTSDFESLVKSGLLDLDRSSRDKNCLVYMRDIQNIGEHLGAKNAGTFVDLCSDTHTWDVGKKGSINVLRNFVEKSITSDNLLKTNISLNGCLLDEDASRKYISEIGRHFFSTVTKMVNERMTSRSSLYKDELLYELSLQWSHVRQCSGPYVSREEMLDAIKSYLLTETDQPLIIVGPRGSGKTSLIAKAASDINEAISNSDISMPTALIVRFVGETNMSRDIQPLLFTLCRQLAYVTRRYSQEVPFEYKYLKNHFIDLVQRGEYGGMLVILIDALDSISSTDNGSKLDWLPPRIASNVKIIITSGSENVDIMRRLENKVEHALTKLPDFNNVMCEELVKKLIMDCSETKKTVWYEEWKRIQTAFSAISSPLYARLVFEQTISQWRPFDEVSKEAIPRSVEEHVCHLFEALEKRHGAVPVQRMLGYLTAAEGGLSESELDDILSLDDTLLNEVYLVLNEYPNIRRMPHYFWARLRQDLRPYLTFVHTDGIATVQWRYKTMALVAKERYRTNGDGRIIEMFSNMADYFLGTWSDTKMKPFKHPAKMMALYKRVDSYDAQCRHVPSQPMSFGNYMLFNNRKLDLLPKLLVKCQRYDCLKSSVFCNYEWIASKLHTTSVQRVITAFDVHLDRETKLVADALRMSKSALRVKPDALAIELIGRLLPHIHKYPYIRDLIRQCDLDVQRCCPLVPNCQIYSAPGGPLQYECDVSAGNNGSPIDIDVFSNADGILLFAKPSYSQRLRVWELTNGEERPDIMLPVGTVKPSKDGKYFNILLENGKLKVFKADTGILHGEMEYGPGKISHVSVSSRYLVLVLFKGSGPYVFDIDRSELLHKFTYHTHAAAIHDSERYIAFNAERSILLYELPTMERRCVGTASDVAHDIIFVNDQPKCYVLTKTKLLETIVFDVINRRTSTKSILTDMEAKECIPSNSKKLMIVRCSKTLHVVDTIKDTVRSRLQKLPTGVFIDNSSQFSGAGFTRDDKLIVAARYTYLIVWDAETCSPVRVLQSDVSPMEKIFTSESANKVVTLLKNHTFQVWDLDNLDQDTDHAVEIHDNAVASLAVSFDTGYITSHDSKTPDARLVCLKSGKLVDTLQHSENSLDRLVEVVMSSDGAYAVTRARIAVDPNGLCSLTLDAVTDDVMWEVETASKVFHAISNRYIAFSPGYSNAAFVTCAFYNRCDWSENIYNVFIVHPETSTNYTIDFPCNTEFVAPPRIVDAEDTGYFVAVVQTSDIKDKQGKQETVRRNDVYLLMQKLNADHNPEDLCCVRVQSLSKEVGPTDAFIDIITVRDEMVLAVYGKDVGSYEFVLDKGILPPKIVRKGAFLYNVQYKTVMKHFPEFLDINSNIKDIQISSQSSIIVDGDMRVFNYENNSFHRQLKSCSFAQGTAKLVLDGRYIVGIAEDKRQIVVIRTNDDKVLGSVFVHGRATCLAVSTDDRTVVVGCDDGRIMILSVILEFADPLKEHIQHLHSRRDDEFQETLITNDIRRLSLTTPDQHRLSALLRQKAREETRRPPSYTTLERGVTISRQSNRRKDNASCSQQ